MSNLKNLAIRGGLWSLVGFASSQILRLGANLVLTRLLAPEFFGLMLLANTLYIGISLFSDFGLQVNIIRSSRGNDPLFLNTAWTIQVLRGIALWLICSIVTLPAANFYGDQRLIALLPLVGFNAVLSGFNSTSLIILNRELNQKPLVILEMVCQICGIVVMLGWAWFAPSVWALASGGLVSTLVRLVTSFYLQTGQPNRFAWDSAAVEEIFTIGKWIMLSTAISFLGQQTDRLTLGKLFPFELLGIYSVAISISDVPLGVISSLSGSIIFPAMSKLADVTRPELRQKILNNRGPLLMAIAVGTALAITYGDFVIEFLYRGKYTQAAWMLPLLLFGIWPRVLYNTIDPVLFVIGKVKYSAFSSAAKTLTNLVCLPLGYSLAGPLGAIGFVALNDLPSYLTISAGLSRNGLSCWRQDLQVSLFFLLCLGVSIGLRALLGLGFPGMDSYSVFRL